MMNELDLTILTLARNNVPTEDICEILKLSKKEFKERITIIKSILNNYKKEQELANLPATKIM